MAVGAAGLLCALFPGLPSIVCGVVWAPPCQLLGSAAVDKVGGTAGRHAMPV